jgi:hypothetical protein
MVAQENEWDPDAAQTMGLLRAGAAAVLAPVTPRENVVYTIAFDPLGRVGTRVMAKLLAASLTRTHFNGDTL